MLQDVILSTSLSGGGRKKGVGGEKNRNMGMKVKMELRVTEIAARETME